MNINIVLQGLLFVGGMVTLSLITMLLVRRVVALSTLEAHNDVAGFVYAVLGVIYAVLLGFVVIVVWGEWEKADFYVTQEAGAVASLARLADGLPEADRPQLREALVAYLRAVTGEEWAAMAQGGESEHASSVLRDIWRIAHRMEPATERQSAQYAEMLKRFTDLEDARLQRLFESKNSVPHVMWTVLGAGAFVTIGFGLLFGVRHVGSQAVITFALSGSIGLLLFLISVLDYPFRGDVRLQPEALEHVLAEIERDGGGPSPQSHP